MPEETRWLSRMALDGSWPRKQTRDARSQLLPSVGAAGGPALARAKEPSSLLGALCAAPSLFCESKSAPKWKVYFWKVCKRFH